jgi:hypothetical protein
MSRHDIKVQFIITGLVVFVSISVYVIVKLQEPDNARSKPVAGGNSQPVSPQGATDQRWRCHAGSRHGIHALGDGQRRLQRLPDIAHSADAEGNEQNVWLCRKICGRDPKGNGHVQWHANPRPENQSDDKVELKFHMDILNPADKSISANNDRTQLMVKSGDTWKIGGGTKSYRPDWDRSGQPEH